MGGAQTRERGGEYKIACKDNILEAGKTRGLKAVLYFACKGIRHVR